MLRVSTLLTLAALALFAGALPLQTTRAQKGDIASLRLVALADFTAYKGGVLVQAHRVVVFEQLSKIYDRQSGKYVIEPEDNERALWSGEEFREITYSWTNGKYEVSSRRFAREAQVPAGVVESSSCDNSNRLVVPMDPKISALLPKNVLVKHVSPIPIHGRQLLALVYTEPSPAGSTSDYATFLAVVDTRSLQTVASREVQRYVEFCSMDVADVTGDGLPEIVIYGYSQGGSGYSKTARLYRMVPAN